MKTDWRQLVSMMWKDNREAILGILGLGTTMGAPAIPLHIRIITGVLTLALLTSVAQSVRATRRLLRQKRLPLVVIAGKNDDQFKDMIDAVWAAMVGRGFNAQEYDDVWDVERDDLVVRRETSLPTSGKSWKEMVAALHRKQSRLGAKLPGFKEYHLFLNCPAALAMGMGARMGTLQSVVLHHFDSTHGYVPVIDFSHDGVGGAGTTHVIKRRTDLPYQYVVAEESDQMGDEVFVSLFLAGHDPRGDVDRLARQRGLPAVHIINTFNNSLPLDADWVRVAQEVSTHLLRILGTEVTRVHLCLSCPVVLAFAIGMALGIQSPVTVYNWFSDLQEYRPVLDLESLRN